MAYITTDKDTGVTHIAHDTITLCGLLDGWTEDDEPVEEKWGCTCSECHAELESLRQIRK